MCVGVVSQMTANETDAKEAETDRGQGRVLQAKAFSIEPDNPYNPLHKAVTVGRRKKTNLARTKGTSALKTY